mgnify:CR=1 FL=1
MRKRRRIAVLSLSLGLCLSLAAPAVAGELNIYYGTSRDLFEPVVQAFGASRPDIKVSSYRAPTEELMATIELEIKAGKPRADVIVIPKEGSARKEDIAADRSSRPMSVSRTLRRAELS